MLLWIPPTLHWYQKRLIEKLEEFIINTWRRSKDIVHGPEHWAVPVALNSLRSKQTQSRALREPNIAFPDLSDEARWSKLPYQGQAEIAVEHHYARWWSCHTTPEQSNWSPTSPKYSSRPGTADGVLRRWLSTWHWPKMGRPYRSSSTSALQRDAATQPLPTPLNGVLGNEPKPFRNEWGISWSAGDGEREKA